MKDFETHLEIYIEDLKEEVQKKVLEYLDLKTPEEGNFDVFPLDIIERVKAKG